MSNAVRIYNENRLMPNRSISEAAYLIRYLRYKGESEDTIKDVIERLFYNIYGELFVFCALVAYKYKIATSQDAKFDVLWSDAFSPTIVGLRTFCSIGNNVNEKIYNFIRNTDCIETTIFKNKDIIKFDDNLLALNCGEPVLIIDNFINIAYYYLEYVGRLNCFRCENCGTILQRRAARNRYCKVCARRIHLNQRRS